MPHHRYTSLRFAIVVCAALLMCLASSSGPGVIAGPAPTSLSARATAAAALMARSLESIKALRRSKGLPIDRELDPNQTGIIGAEFTPLTTSLGEVDAKRTSANPAFAAVLVKYLSDAGLMRGDVVAIGASGSFPALLLATLSAVRVLELEPVVIYSVGASMYGANLPGFTFVDMLARLRADGLLPYHIAAVSPGGDEDNGTGVLFDDTGTVLMAETRRSGLPVVGGASLAERIQWRLRAYDAAAGGRPVRCFVNIGGASANFGDTPESLALPNGLVRRVASVPASSTRGLVFEFASRGVPVVHLLHVAGLARDNHLPYDPIPLTRSGKGGTHGRH
jgi:poly-gamma-glutamate system protein